MAGIDGSSDRLKVPGGWIVRSLMSLGVNAISIHQIFVPDPEYKWKLNAQQKYPTHFKYWSESFFSCFLLNTHPIYQEILILSCHTLFVLN